MLCCCPRRPSVPVAKVPLLAPANRVVADFWGKTTGHCCCCKALAVAVCLLPTALGVGCGRFAVEVMEAYPFLARYLSAPDLATPIAVPLIISMLCVLGWFLAQIRSECSQHARHPCGLPPTTADLLRTLAGAQSENFEVAEGHAESLFKLCAGSCEVISVQNHESLLERIVSTEVQDFVKICPIPAFQLLDKADADFGLHVTAFFNILDTDHSGSIDLQEWQHIFGENSKLLLTRAVRVENYKKRVYWHRNAEEMAYSRKTSAVEDKMSQFASFASADSQIFVEEELSHFAKCKSDFWFFAANNHPLLAPLCCYPDSGLEPWSRLILEFAAMNLAIIPLAFSAFLFSEAFTEVAIQSPPNPIIESLVKFVVAQLMINSFTGYVQKNTILLYAWPTSPANLFDKANPTIGCPGSTHLWRMFLLLTSTGLPLVCVMGPVLEALMLNSFRFMVFKILGYIQWFPMNYCLEFVGVSHCISKLRGKVVPTKWESQKLCPSGLGKVSSCDILKMYLKNLVLSVCCVMIASMMYWCWMLA